ncbi:hypothetical protein RhiirC2_799498 [Rhizophagus irregularis]|uniref:Uncharacterized protein n=1 Tax=Rhizophagus irregularis TaxID=588596 RepID=A0A2N1M4Y1_9GLOM|nr:hypothetical protein RhiirC2_799498 [Rhizophagus irregularis]
MNALYSDVEIGYTLEVDLEVPVHLHDFFVDYPLAPEKQIVPEEWLSLYNERLVQDKEVGGGKYTTGEKLVQTLYPKKELHGPLSCTPVIYKIGDESYKDSWWIKILAVSMDERIY